MFSSASRLVANIMKSCVYLSRVDVGTNDSILAILGMPLGDFPFKYFGVTVHSNKLTTIDCITLVERETVRLKSWSAKLLSYAGRFQLVRSELMVIQAFWAQVFCLP